MQVYFHTVLRIKRLTMDFKTMIVPIYLEWIFRMYLKEDKGKRRRGTNNAIRYPPAQENALLISTRLKDTFYSIPPNCSQINPATSFDCRPKHITGTIRYFTADIEEYTVCSPSPLPSPPLLFPSLLTSAFSLSLHTLF